MKNRVVLVSLNKYMQMVKVILKTKNKKCIYFVHYAFKYQKNTVKVEKLKTPFILRFEITLFLQNLTHTKYNRYDRITRKLLYSRNLKYMNIYF